MSANHTREELCLVVANSLGVSAAAVDANASSATVSQWDSQHHLMVVLTVEGAFGVRFATEEIPTLDSIRALADRLGIKLD